MSLLEDVLRQVGGPRKAPATPTDPRQRAHRNDVRRRGVEGPGGLVDMFNQKGLGDVVSPGRVGRTFRSRRPVGRARSAQVQALAAKAGIDPQRASQVIAQILPHLVDRATPNGQMPPGGILDAISGFFKK